MDKSIKIHQKTFLENTRHTKKKHLRSSARCICLSLLGRHVKGSESFERQKCVAPALHVHGIAGETMPSQEFLHHLLRSALFQKALDPSIGRKLYFGCGVNRVHLREAQTIEIPIIIECIHVILFVVPKIRLRRNSQQILWLSWCVQLRKGIAPAVAPHPCMSRGPSGKP